MGCFEGGFKCRPVGQGTMEARGGRTKERVLKAEENRDMVGASRGKGVGPLCKVGSKEGASKGKVCGAGAHNERHGKPGKDTRDVEESEPQFRGLVKVGSRDGDLVFFEYPKWVCHGVVDVEIAQGECGEGGRRKNNVRRDRAGVVETTLCALRVDDREASRGGVEKIVRDEEVQSHKITPSENAAQERNRIQKGPVNVKSNARLAAPVGGREKTIKKLKEGSLPL